MRKITRPKAEEAKINSRFGQLQNSARFLFPFGEKRHGQLRVCEKNMMTWLMSIEVDTHSFGSFLGESLVRAEIFIPAQTFDGF